MRHFKLRTIGTLMLAVTMLFTTVGFTNMTVGIPGLPDTYYTITGSPFAACSKKNPDAQPETPEQRKARIIGYFRQAQGALDDLIPVVSTLNPRAGEIIVKIKPIMGQIIDAIDRGDLTSAAGLLRTVLPLVNSIAPMFTGNIQVLAGVATVSIVLRLLANNLPESVILRGAVADEIETFKKSAVWECQYQPKLCKEMGIK